MISIMKEICIFMIIVQGILCFVPGNSYIKYVRILVGIILILRITEPILSLVAGGDVRQEIDRKVSELERSISMEQQKLEIEDREMGIYNSIEEELKERLRTCEGDYVVEKVELVDGEKTESCNGKRIPSGDNLRILITVSPRKEGKTRTIGEEIRIESVDISQNGKVNEIQDEKLKEQYSECIGVNPENIEIAIRQGW